MALILESATISTDGRSLTLVFNDTGAVGTNVPTSAGLTATFGGTSFTLATAAVRTMSSDPVVTRTVVYRLSRVVRRNETLTISGGAGLVVCPSGSSDAFTNVPVTNNSAQWIGIYVVKEDAVAITGDGSYGTPYAYFNELPSVMQAGDEIHLWGDVGFEPASGGGYSGPVRSWTVNHLTFRVAEGAPYGNLVGYKNIATGTMTYNGGAQTATVNIGTGRSVAGVAVNYSYVQISTGKVWSGFCKPASSAAQVGTAGYEDAFHYDSGTGVLKFGTAYSGVDPNSQPTGWVKWFEGNYAAAAYVAGNHTRVLGINTNGHLDTSAGKGYPIKIAGYGGEISDGEFSMSGYHGPCFVSEDSNYPCGNFEIKRCTYAGAGGGSSPTLVALYGNTGTIRGGRVRQCNFLMYTPLAADGTTPLYTSSCSGVYCHTDGTTGVIGDIEVDLCVFQSVQGNAGWPASASNCSAPLDIYDPRTWPVRFKRCRTIDTISGMIANGNAAAHAWINCDLDFLQYGPNTTRSSASACWNSSVSAGLGNLYIGFFGCSLRWDGKDSTLNTLSNAPALFFASAPIADANLYFVSVNSSFVECSSTTPNPPTYCTFFTCANRGCKFRVRNSVFAYRHNPGGAFNYLITSDTNLAGTPFGDHDFAGCLYEKFGAFSNKTGITSQALWSANIDTTAKGGLYSTGDSFANLPTDVSLSTSSTVFNSIAVQPQWYDGVNDRAYSGTRGGWQYGPRLYPDSEGPRLVQGAYRRASLTRLSV